MRVSRKFTDSIGGGSALVVLLAALAIGAWLSFSPALLNDGDTSWHLATGQWILAHQSIPHVDPFSFTFRGHAWTAHEWLADVLMAVMFRIGGWGGLALPFAISAALLFALVGRELSRALPPRYVAVALAVLATVLAPFMLARPHLLTWPLLACWLIILMRAREEHRAPAIWWALIILLWANIHASFLVALGIAGVFGVEALIEQKRARGTVVLHWGAFGLACLVAAFVTPHGLQAFLYPLEVSQMKALPLIGEWRATSLSKDWPFCLFAAAVGVFAVVRFRNVLRFRFLLLALFAVMALSHARHQPLFAITAVLLLLPASRAATPRKGFALLAAGLAGIAVVRLAFSYDRGDGPTFPATAIGEVPAELRSAPLFNDYSFGGPLIVSGIAPFIDGRSDMYGDDFTIEQHRIVMGDRRAFDRSAARWNFQWTILAPSAPLARLLDRDPNWRPIYRDRFAVVHVRQAHQKARH